MEVNGNGKNKTFVDPREKEVRKRTVAESERIRNEKSNPRMPRIDLKFLAGETLRRAGAHRQMKASLRGLPSSHGSLGSGNATLLKSNNVSTDGRKDVKIRKKSIAIVCGNNNNRIRIKANKRATMHEAKSSEEGKEPKETRPGNRG